MDVNLPSAEAETEDDAAASGGLQHQAQAGRLLNDVIQGLGMNRQRFGEAHGIAKASVGRLVKSDERVTDVTRVKVAQAIRGYRDKVEDGGETDTEGADVRGLLDRTHEVMTALLAQDGDAFDYLWKLWRYRTGRKPVITQYQVDIRSGSMNFPDLHFLLQAAAEAGLIPADKAKRPWEVPDVAGDAVRVWQAESVKLGRPEPIVRLMTALQLAGLSTFQHQLPKLKAQCDALGIAVPDGADLTMTQLNAITLAGYGYVPFGKVEPIARAVGAHIGRPDLADELRGPWEAGAEEAGKRVTTGSTLEQLTEDDGWTTKELCGVLGIAYDPHGAMSTTVRKLFESSRHTMPLRRLALLFARSPLQMQELERARVAELAAHQRLRGRRRPLNEVATARLLWGLETDELGVDREQLTDLENDQRSDLEPADVLAAIHRKGTELATGDLRRYLERRALLDAGQVTRAICERHKLGNSGDGTAKVAKDTGIGPDYLKRALGDGATMPMHVLRRLLKGMEGIEPVPARLEIDHRLARAEHLAGQKDNAHARFIDAVTTENHLSVRDFNMHAVTEAKQREALNKLLKHLRAGTAQTADVRAQTAAMLTAAGVPEGDLRRGVGEVLADANGDYPVAIARLLHWMHGQDDYAAHRRDLLALLAEIDGGTLAQPAALPAEGTSVHDLLARKQAVVDERAGATWDPERTEFDRLRAAARALRWLPGITRGELVTAAEGLRRERLMAEAHSLVADHDAEYTPDTRRRTVEIIMQLADDAHPEEQILRSLGLPQGTYRAWYAENFRYQHPVAVHQPPIPFSHRIPAERLSTAAPEGIEVPEDLRTPVLGAQDVGKLAVRWQAAETREAVRRRLGLASVAAADETDDEDPPPDEGTVTDDVHAEAEPEEPGLPPDELALLLPAVTEPLPAETPREYAPHPNDASGVDFARMRHDVHLLGEYLRHYLAPRSAGYELHEPETVSLARAAVTTPNVNTHNVAMMLRMLLRSYGRMPEHHGTGLLLLRLRELAGNGEHARVNRALLHVLGDPADRLRAAELADQAPDGPLAALIATAVPLDRLRADVPAAAPDDAEIYEAPPETPKPAATSVKPAKKKKTAARKADPAPTDADAWMAAHAELLAELDAEDEADELSQRRRKRRSEN